MFFFEGDVDASLTMFAFRFELYERNHGRGKSDKEYSIKLSLSEGAHSSNVLDSTLDARHSLNVQPRRCDRASASACCSVDMTLSRKLTQHLPYSLVIEKLSKHFGRMIEVGDKLSVATSSNLVVNPLG